MLDPVGHDTFGAVRGVKGGGVGEGAEKEVWSIRRPKIQLVFSRVRLAADFDRSITEGFSGRRIDEFMSFFIPTIFLFLWIGGVLLLRTGTTIE